MRVLDALTGQVAAELLACSHLLAPQQVPEPLMDTAGPLGVTKARVYPADLEQRYLRAMPGGTGQSPELLAIDSTVAGHAYRTIRFTAARRLMAAAATGLGFRWSTEPNRWGPWS